MVNLTPVLLLTWNTPEVHDFYQMYWEKHIDDIDPTETTHYSQYPELYHPRLHPLLVNLGYLTVDLPMSEDLLDNDIHPLFGPEHWIYPLPMDVFFEEAQLALQLATKFLGTPEVMDWFVRLRYGVKRRDAEGRVFLDKGQEEDRTDARTNVIEDIKQLAGRIKFPFLADCDFRSSDGMCIPYVESVVHVLQKKDSEEDEEYQEDREYEEDSEYEDEDVKLDNKDKENRPPNTSMFIFGDENKEHQPLERCRITFGDVNGEKQPPKGSGFNVDHEDR
jgi:hypothetical protein